MALISIFLRPIFAVASARQQWGEADGGRSRLATNGNWRWMKDTKVACMLLKMSLSKLVKESCKVL
jgi:hypothetical protein